MKYVVLLGDGMADEPMAELGGKTPLQCAHTPYMDRLAREGQVGLAQTIPEGYPPGSDVANLSVFGYDPASCYSGRSPLEAASMGVSLNPEDVSFRLNLVTLGEKDGQEIMVDFSAGHISTEEAHAIVVTLQEKLGTDRFQFYPGVSYRHLLVWRGGTDAMAFTPPHDITGQPTKGQLPRGEGSDCLLDIMQQARTILATHPVNLKRQVEGKSPANAAWLWGQGRAPHMPTMQERFGLNGAVISAVDLIKGIGIYAGLDVIEVPGATGYIDTNYLGKAQYALEALKTRDYVYIHVEAPDEASHAGLLQEKIRAIEAFDELVVGTVFNGMQSMGAFRLLVAPDHPTPVTLMTHTSDPIPFILYGSQGEFLSENPVSGYDEPAAASTGVFIPHAYQLMDRLVCR